MHTWEVGSLRLTPGLSDGEDLGPCSSGQGQELSQVDEEGGEAKRETRPAEQPEQRQLLALDLCQCKGLPLLRETARPVICKLLSFFFKSIKACTCS